MAKERIFNLPQTKGSFELKGKITGTSKDNFYKEIKTKGGKDMRLMNCGVEYDTGKTQYISLTGMPRDTVYFSKRGEKGEKPDVKQVPWANRFNPQPEGYRMMGVNLGVTKVLNDKGEIVNDKKVVTEYDACKEIKANLTDGKSVYVRGSLDFGSYIDDKGNTRRSTKMVPNQVSLCADVNFGADNYETINNFDQNIIFMGIDKEKVDEKDTGRFILSAKIVNYNTIEDAEFIVEDGKLATIFKKHLKAYNAINVSGHMQTTIATEEVEDSDYWGEPNPMKKVNSSAKREFVITGATQKTLDTETYTKQNVEEAIEKINRNRNAESNFGNNDSWGDTSGLSAPKDEDDEW